MNQFSASVFGFCLVLLFVSVEGACPGKGTLGNRPKDLLNLVPSQTGYESWIEVAENTVLKTRMHETYFKDREEGHVSTFKDWIKTDVDYYYHSDEVFVRTRSCTVSSLTAKKGNVIRSLLPELAKDELYDLFGLPLGPVSLLLSLASREDGRYTTGDEYSTFSYCKDGSYEIEVNYDLKTDLPVFMTIGLGTSNSPESVIQINFLRFQPRTDKQSYTTYPYDDCDRLKPTDPETFPTFPAFRISGNDFKFYLELEASISLQNVDNGSFVDRARVSFVENTLSVETRNISSRDRTLVKSVYDRHTGTTYTITETGECQQIESIPIQPESKLFVHPLSWPYLGYAKKYSFNLLDPELWSVFVKREVQYYGQTMLEGKLVDIYARTLSGFFRWYLGARAIYFFEVTSSKERVPKKIVIKSLPSRFGHQHGDFLIDLNIVHYTEKNYDNHAFDVSACFPDAREYQYFQVSFSDSLNNILSLLKADVEIEDSFRQQLHSYLKVPEIRVPTIKTTFYGNRLYISGKLLGPPRFDLRFNKIFNMRVENGDSVNYVDSPEECAQICLDEGKNCDFSYCNNLKCEVVYKTKNKWGETAEDENCNFYYASNDIADDFNPLAFTSTNKLISYMKKNVKGLFIEVDKKPMFADDVYPVSGPDDIGRYDQDGEWAINTDPLQVEYKLVMERHKIMDIRAVIPVGLTRKECLEECENDENCHSVSYCSNTEKECKLSSLMGSELTKENTKFSDFCNTYSRNYVSYYNVMPGQALVKDGIKVFKAKGTEECARVCLSSHDLDCNSFDLCSSHPEGKSTERVCILHSFHIAIDREPGIDAKIWNLDKKECSHYSRKFSLDFVPKLFHKYKDERLPISQTGKSVESCAGLCIQESCKSFEFCENGKPSQSSCRISGFDKIDYVNFVETNKGDCTIHIARSEAASTGVASSKRLKFVLGLGSIFFIIATVAGAVGFFFIKKRLGS